MKLSEWIQEQQRQLQLYGDADVIVMTEDSVTEYNDMTLFFDEEENVYSINAIVDDGSGDT